MKHQLSTLKKVFFRSSLICLLLSILAGQSLWATHNLGGHIRAEHISGTTYKLILTTYTDPAPAGVDRCAGDLDIWSISSTPTLQQSLNDIPRRNGIPLMNIPSDCLISNPLSGATYLGSFKKNIYDTIYTFPAPGTYEIRYADIARNSNVINMTDPEEVDIYLSCEIVIPSGNITDKPPLFLNENLYDYVCAGQIWTHNPGGFDPDGDSLIYSLRAPYYYLNTMTNTPMPVPGYLYPDDPSFGVSSLSMDSLTGNIVWDAPLQTGLYALAYQVEAYRNGVYQGRMIGETTITVISCQLEPPILSTPEQLFAIAGDTLMIPVLAYNNTLNDSLYLELNNAGLGNNGLFSGLPFNPPMIHGATSGGSMFNSLPFATFNSGSTPDTIEAEISWVPDCSEIGKTYQIDYWAHNNLAFPLPWMTKFPIGTYQSTQVTVLPPAPQNITVTIDTLSGAITINWDSTICFQPDSYHIYLSTDSLLGNICGDTSLLSLVGQVLGNDSLSFTIIPQNIINSNLCFYITAVYKQFGQSCLSLPVCVSNYTTSLEEELNPIIGPFDFQVYDLQGRFIEAGITDDRNPQVSHLPKGVYIIRLQKQHWIGIKKVLNW